MGSCKENVFVGTYDFMFFVSFSKHVGKHIKIRERSACEGNQHRGEDS